MVREDRSMRFLLNVGGLPLPETFDYERLR